MKEGVRKYTHYFISGALEVFHQFIILKASRGSWFIFWLCLSLHPLDEHQVLLFALEGIENVGGGIHESKHLL